MNKKHAYSLSILIIALAATALAFLFFEKQPAYNLHFSGQQILQNIKEQLSFGPRFVGSEGHQKEIDYLLAQTQKYSQDIKIQTWQQEFNGQPETLTNIIVSFYPEKKERVIVAAHFDSKKTANRDPDNKQQPVIGANDSASGTAILLEMAKYLSQTKTEPNTGIDLIFLDAEDPEDEPGKTWAPVGSVYFTDHLKDLYPENDPKLAIVIDMVCDKNLNIYKETSSVEKYPNETNAFWSYAKKVNANGFRQSIRYTITDDHSPFLKKNIPSFLIIDMDYPYWHTGEDTIDKCSADSLEQVGNTLLDYLYSLN
jgi:glutaminyl-peptide cyclotransferase